MSKPLKAEIIDQALHVIVGAALVFIFSFVLPPVGALLFSITIGVVREIFQRWDRNRVAFDFGVGSRRDMLFWAIGSFSCYAVIY